MGQVRNETTELIDSELRTLLPEGFAVETRQDTYTQDYIIWVNAGGEEAAMVQPFRITRDEFLQDDWRNNVRRLVTEIGNG